MIFFLTLIKHHKSFHSLKFTSKNSIIANFLPNWIFKIFNYLLQILKLALINLVDKRYCLIFCLENWMNEKFITCENGESSFI